MNKANVLALCHKVEQKTGLSFNTVLLYYFLESILKRLTDGENKDSFRQMVSLDIAMVDVITPLF
ncbi:hypothetical protein [Murdochiella vaginalis]|uniref:hypothetical protein n=1 Tax=Murdochiella vaginalis TaxID=1852373 RepID=UPI0008FDBEEB|nr:hypothetical protein [Murdochiella vaginalis]